MKHDKILYVAAAMLLFASCLGGTENSTDDVNPLWGLWMQTHPATAVKNEIMFNEDCTGFLFCADTLVAETVWEQGDVLGVRFSSSTDSTLHGLKKRYRTQINGDTLLLMDAVTGLETTYRRVTD